MKRENKWGKTLLILALVATAVGYWVLLYQPGQRQIAELRKQIEQKREIVSKSGTVGAAIHTTEKEIERATSYNQVWERGAPTLAELSTLFGQISGLSRSHQATTMQFDPDPAVRRDRLSEIPLRIALAGPFTQISQFVYELERLTSSIWIESLRLDVSAKDGKSVTGAMDLLIFADNPEISGYANTTGNPIQ